MRPASNLGDAVRVVELVITGVTISLEIAGEVGQLALGMCAGAIGGELIPDQRGGRGAAAAIVDGVSPKPAGRRLAPARIKHGNRRIVGMGLRGGQADFADATDDRVEQHGCLSTQPANVERSISTPCAAMISAWR